ncbi:hypothetical protein LJC37_00055 [Bacteroidales bacterium OttesenSCG-928-E04]|nr:hypothetical protein [Bacteroidales bacterium OttesenSCG-928-E04]
MKDELQEELTPPLALDLATQRKMAKVVDEKTYWLNVSLAVLSLFVTLTEIGVLLPLIASNILKTVFIMMSVSVVTFLILFFIINLKSKKEKGVLS